MQVYKTHIVLKENTNTVLGFTPMIVYECKTAENKSYYFRKYTSGFGETLEMINEEDFRKLENKTLEVLGEVYNEEVKVIKRKCPNAKEPGGCQLHNLFCKYPECEL